MEQFGCSCLGYYSIHEGKCGLVEEDIEEIVTHPWDRLESLWLSYNHFGVKGIKTLSSKDWPKL